MYDLFAIFAGLVIGIGFLLIVARALENRAKAHGSLFTQHPTIGARISSAFLALIFGAVFIFELLFQDMYHVIFPILSLALFFYTLGVTKLLANLQRETGEELKNELDEDGH